MKAILSAALAAVILTSCGNPAPQKTASEAAVSASSAAVAGSTDTPAARKVKENFLSGCVQSAVSESKGAVQQEKIEQLCNCAYGELVKQYPNEDAWVEAAIRMEIAQKPEADFTGKMAKAGRICLNQNGG